MTTVTFCGHSSLHAVDCDKLKERLFDEIEKLVLQGATDFLLGGYGAFDYLCARTVKEVKGKYPHIKSILVVPYMYRDYDKDLYDGSEYPPIENTPPVYAIVKRNEYMVKKADAVIAYVAHSVGGASKTYEYAMRKKDKLVINLALEN